MVQRVRLARRIAVARAKKEPWATIIARERIPERTARDLLAKYQAESDELEDPFGIVRETLSLYDAALHDLSEIALNGDNSAAKVGAIRLTLETSKARVELLACAGMFPRNLSRAREEIDLITLINRIMKILEQADLPEEVIADLSAVIKEMSARGPSLLPARA